MLNGVHTYSTQFCLTLVYESRTHLKGGAYSRGSNWRIYGIRYTSDCFHTNQGLASSEHERRPESLVHRVDLPILDVTCAEIRCSGDEESIECLAKQRYVREASPRLGVRCTTQRRTVYVPDCEQRHYAVLLFVASSLAESPNSGTAIVMPN